MHKKRSQQSGFTLIELAVTMGIFAVLVSVVLANYRTFSSKADFLNVADNIALSLREAQIYGVGSKGAVNKAGTSVSCGSPASTFNCAYGVSFKQGESFYTAFVDGGTTVDKAFSGNDEVVEVVGLPLGTQITSIQCFKDNIQNCATSGRVDITFKRPDPDAVIIPVSGTIPGITEQDSAVITVENSVKKSDISISRSGQISVKTINK